MSKVSKIKEQCPFCKKWFIHLNKHKCNVKSDILNNPKQKDLFGNDRKAHFQKWLEIERSHIRKEEEKIENSVYTYWEVDGKKLRAFNINKHECFLKADIPDFIKMKIESFDTLWKRMMKGQFKTIDYEYFKIGLHYTKMRRDEAISRFNLNSEIISPRGDKVVYFITRVGLKIMLLHTNQEYPVYIAHRLFELEYINERNTLYKKEVFPISHEKVKKLRYVDYKNSLAELPLNPEEIYIDIYGNKMDSKGEVLISTACAMLEMLTGEKLEHYHPDIIKISKEEREYYKNNINHSLLIKARWDGDRFPYQLEPDFGFIRFPDVVFEYFGWHGEWYEARRKIKEIIYKDKGKRLFAIEKDQDSNLPNLIEMIIKNLQLRKRKGWRNKL